jgi:hypothetical protein
MERGRLRRQRDALLEAGGSLRIALLREGTPRLGSDRFDGADSAHCISMEFDGTGTVIVATSRLRRTTRATSDEPCLSSRVG